MNRIKILDYACDLQNQGTKPSIKRERERDMQDYLFP